jgi:hypothetical protein
MIPPVEQMGVGTAPSMELILPKHTDQLFTLDGLTIQLVELFITVVLVATR